MELSHFFIVGSVSDILPETLPLPDRDSGQIGGFGKRVLPIHLSLPLLLPQFFPSLDGGGGGRGGLGWTWVDLGSGTPFSPLLAEREAALSFLFFFSRRGQAGFVASW